MSAATGSRPQSSLPTALTGLVGRVRERAELRALLAPDSGGPRLLTLTGVGGGGKTRLALAVAKMALGRYPDGV